jgi:hypothetical protein
VRPIASEVVLDALDKAGLKIVIIGLGSHSLISPYKRETLITVFPSSMDADYSLRFPELTGSRLPIFTDPTLALHRTLGMILKTTNAVSDFGHRMRTSR